MLQPAIFTGSRDFAAAFDRCCRTYDRLDIAVAWAGSPDANAPFDSLRSVSAGIRATIGVAFCHTHPDAIERLLRLRAEVRVFDDSGDLFHPKLYLFRRPGHAALFVGSSNLTYGGFVQNVETNVLLEGEPDAAESERLQTLQSSLDAWHSPTCSIKPTASWLAGYRKRYRAAHDADVKTQRQTPPSRDTDDTQSFLLRSADWSTYYAGVCAGLQRLRRSLSEWTDVLDAARNRIPFPWQTNYFRDLENRRIIGGIASYAWFGHVSASGSFRKLLANGSPAQHRQIVNAINAATNLSPPVDPASLAPALASLTALGPTIKVWSRLLCITRPDIYCTVAAESVREGLARALRMRSREIATVPGYARLIQTIHASPWFKSPQPTDRQQNTVWRNRAAFLDAIFYSE